MFLAGSSNGSVQCLDVNVTDDGFALEGDETFYVLLNTSDTVHLWTGSSQTVISIRDNGVI